MSDSSEKSKQTDQMQQQYSDDKIYNKGDRVSYQSSTYEAAFWTKGKNPKDNYVDDGDYQNYGKEWIKIVSPSGKGEDNLFPETPSSDDKTHEIVVSPSLDAHPIEKWFTEDIWDDLFPKENDSCFEDSKPYSFLAFITAVRRFPDFAGSNSELEQKKEVAALLGICLQEVGGKSLQNNGNLTFPGLTKTACAGFAEPRWDNIPSYKWNLAFSSETGAEGHTNYDTGYTLQPNQKYFSGAGILQLSYPANYARFSDYYFGDKEVLLNDSDRVRKEGDLAIGSGIFYWMSPADARPSPHCCFTGSPVNEQDNKCYKRITAQGYKQGLAMVICAVNGIECGIPADYRVATRVYGYLEYGKHFGLTDNQLMENCSLETADMPPNLNTV